MNFVSFEELVSCIYKNLYKIPADVDLVVGIPRSGTLVANIIALYRNLPFTDINSFIEKRVLSSGSTRKSRDWVKSVGEARHVLIVDDSISSGKAIREAKEKIKDSDITAKVTYLAVYSLKGNAFMVDIHFKVCQQPRMFEWNYMHHWMLEFACMDIDGVLCDDPKINQRIGEKEYKKFLDTATPKIIPTQKVGALVSGRKEKYRQETEKWLHNYNVQYDKLFMLPDDSMLTHAEFKANIYKQSKYILFFESNSEQAAEICRLTGKPVFCVDKKKIFTSKNLIKQLPTKWEEKRITLKRIIRKLAHKIDYVK